MRALVVEDEKTPRELLRDLVPWAKHGFDPVDTARNGLEALEILEAGGVDLVVTDVRMPKMDGIELAVEVRRRWPDCVLVFLSGYSDKEYLKTAIRVQAQDYLDKPIDLTQVEASVAQAAATVQRLKLSHYETELEVKLL
jgi:two-component system response regulator YesN